VLPCSANADTVSPDDTQAVERATAEFYKSLNLLFAGDASAMKRIWSHSDDVTYMGPAGGMEIGWKRVSANWDAQAALGLRGEVVPDEIHVTFANDMAVVQCREVGHNLDAEGRPVQVSIRATNVFREENGQWKMVGHHTDLLPFLAEKP
jgi:ketosteroid isomerase-like protein